MKSTLNSVLLAQMVKTKRGEKGLRAAATEIGEVSAATLSRIEQGRLPDVDTFIRICKWLDVSTDFFTDISNPSGTASNKDMVVTHLRADRTLKPDVIAMLVKMIEVAYVQTVK